MSRQTRRAAMLALISVTGLPLGYWIGGMLFAAPPLDQRFYALFETHCLPYLQERLVAPEGLERFPALDGTGTVGFVDPDTALVLGLSVGQCSVSDVVMQMTPEEQTRLQIRVEALASGLEGFAPGKPLMSMDNWEYFALWDTRPAFERGRKAVLLARAGVQMDGPATRLTINVPPIQSFRAGMALLRRP